MTISVITGCSTGIGYATAQRLVADGHRVIATMRSPEGSDLAAVAREQGHAITLMALDVNDDDAVDAAFLEIAHKHGPVDVLVNNAGIGGSGVVEEADLQLYRDLMETNFFGTLRCIKAVLPSMRERGSGTIVNVTSQAGVIAMPVMSPYCASKYALEAASEALSIEVAPFGIRVAIMEPGAIMTAIWNKVDQTPPSGPYAPIVGRLGMATVMDVMKASPAADVADCISAAITTDSPELRYLVGQGAERNVAIKAAHTHQQISDLWNGPEADYIATMLPDLADG